MEAKVLEPLNALETSLNALVSSLTTTNTFSIAPTAARDLVSADDALTIALNQLKQHQENYTRILHLRSEAERLQSQIKDIVRTCLDFRSEIGSIHPSILEDDSSEDDSEQEPPQTTNPKIQNVDYETLLSFAARIGKHNAAAAREAEQDSTRLKTTATRQKAQINGDNSDPSASASLSFDTQPAETNNNDNEPENNTTQESQDRIAAINDVLAHHRANTSMAFPPPDRLRMGALGQLQLLQEQQGEEAVEAEIERLVRETEDHVKEEGVGSSQTESNEKEEVRREETQGKIEDRTQNRQGQSSGRLAPPPAPTKVKPVSLDFDDESDED